MFSNIGGKIKTLAVLITVVGIFISLIGGVALMANSYGEEMQILGFMIIVVGSLVSWVSSFVLYGYGEIIAQLMRSNDITSEILRRMNPNAAPQASAPAHTEVPYEAPVKTPAQTSAETPVYTQPQYTAPAPSWTCSCGNTNNAEANFCRFCGSKKN